MLMYQMPLALLVLHNLGFQDPLLYGLDRSLKKDIYCNTPWYSQGCCVENAVLLFLIIEV